MKFDKVDKQNIKEWTNQQREYENKQEKLRSLEKTQSHIFIFFKREPYVSLGWKNYRIVNNGINLLLENFQKTYGVEVFFHEKPIFLDNIENFELFLDRALLGIDNSSKTLHTKFFWCLSFFHSDTTLLRNITTKLTEELIKELNDKSREYLKENALYVFNNHDPKFYTKHSLYPYYKSLIAFGEEEFAPKKSFDPQKNYKEQIFDHGIFLEPLPINKVLEVYKEYSNNLNEEYLFRLDPAGFHSNKAKKDGNKFFREELMPIVSFLNHFCEKYNENETIYFGLKNEKYDFRLNLENDVLLGEVVSAYIPNDHLLFSITRQMDYRNVLPAKNAHKYKQQKDSLVENILKSIQGKHEKKYNDERVLIVNFSIDYLYANSKAVFYEIIKEVQQKSEIGAFRAVYLTCEKLCDKIF